MSETDSKPNSSKHSVPKTFSIREYILEMNEAIKYCLARPGVLASILLDAACWAVGTLFLLFLLFHAARVFQFTANDELQFILRALEITGIGALIGAFAISKINLKLSPILSCMPAFILMAIGLSGILNSGADLLALFALGLGGGLVVGRTAPDLNAAVDPKFHDRVFMLKKIVCAAAIALALLIEAVLSNAQFESFIFWMPSLLYFSLPFVFALSWLSDIAIHTQNEIVGIPEFPGPVHRLGYRALRGLGRLILKPLFHFQPANTRNIPESGGLVIAANHGSFLDPIFLSCATDRLIQYVIYSSYYHSLAHPIFRFFRCIPVDEHDQLGALRTGVRSLKLGACIGIFPEGEVSADGKLHPPMRGALFLAQRAGAAVIPAALKGDHDALPRGDWIPHSKPVTPIFGRPFAVDKELTKEQTEALTDKLMVNLAQKLDVAPPPKAPEEVDDARSSVH